MVVVVVVEYFWLWWVVDFGVCVGCWVGGYGGGLFVVCGYGGGVGVGVIVYGDCVGYIF